MSNCTMLLACMCTYLILYVYIYIPILCFFACGPRGTQLFVEPFHFAGTTDWIWTAHHHTHPEASFLDFGVVLIWPIIADFQYKKVLIIAVRLTWLSTFSLLSNISREERLDIIEPIGNVDRCTAAWSSSNVATNLMPYWFLQKRMYHL